MLKITSIIDNVTPVRKPYDHQVEARKYLDSNPAFALFMDMGTGKSKVIIDEFTSLFLERKIDGVLIVAPKGCYLNWPESEIPAHLPEALKPYVRIGSWDASQTIKEFSKLAEITNAKDDTLDILCINVEALATEKGYNFARAFVINHYTEIIVDESQCIKNHKAKRSKALYKLRDSSEYRRILSGTPTTNSPLDIWGQAEFLKPGLLKFDQYLMFRLYYAYVKKVEHGNRRYEVITGYRNIPELTANIKEFSYRKLKEECLDLPPKVFQTVFIERTPEQEKVYQTFKKEAMVQFDGGEITSTSVLKTISKLHQINCGHVITDDGRIVLIENNRISTMLEILEGINGKVLIWAIFRQDIVSIVEAIAKEYGEESVVHYYGETTDSARREALDRIKNDHKCRFFVANPESAGRSLTLTEATYSIYYSYSHKLESYLQSLDRNHRPGQKSTVVYIHIAVKKSIDTKTLKALQDKKSLSSEVLDDLKRLLVDC